MKEESPRCLPARRGLSVSYRGKPLLSTIDPIARAERVVRDVPLGERRLYIVESPLLGYGIQELLDRCSADSAVLCLECDERLFAFSQAQMPPTLFSDPRLRMICTREPKELCAFVRKAWGPRKFRKALVLRLGEGSRLHQGDYDEMVSILERDISLDWFNALTLTRLGRLYARNALRNLPLLASAHDLSQLDYSDMPILVLGAGPSLDHALEILSRLVPSFAVPGARKFRMICVDTALPVLRARGIREDLAVALEAQHWNLRDFVGLPTPADLAMDLSALPSTARAAGGRAYLYSTQWTPLRIFERLRASGLLPAALPPLGSVGLSATTIALSSGSGPVLTAGLDFAFRPEAFHARGTPGHQERLRSASRLRSPVDVSLAYGSRTFAAAGKNGAALRSDPALKGYRDLFEREFGAESRLYDIGTDGLDLGVPRLNLEDAAEILCLGSCRAPVEAPPASDTRDKIEDFIKEERTRIFRLQAILSGQAAPCSGELDRILDDCDYLWAHFPECAALEGRRPESSNIAFLKRVRAELGIFQKALDLALEELTRPWT